jgi:5-formyltetrahydrofolate cyclo-ligase
MTASDVKKVLRQEAKERRDAIVDQAAAAAAITEQVADILALAGAADPVVSAYIAIGSEIDPAPLIVQLSDQDATIALPVMTAKDHPLEFRAWAPGAPLVERMWGIREPGDGCPVVEPDILLVPLLLVDRAGFRLGYGGGFYDRTLAKLRAQGKITAIGVAYEEQRVDAVPHDDYDERLDFLLTPSGLKAC